LTSRDSACKSVQKRIPKVSRRSLISRDTADRNRRRLKNGRDVVFADFAPPPSRTRLSLTHSHVTFPFVPLPSSECFLPRRKRLINGRDIRGRKWLLEKVTFVASAHCKSMGRTNISHASNTRCRVTVIGGSVPRVGRLSCVKWHVGGSKTVVQTEGQKLGLVHFVPVNGASIRYNVPSLTCCSSEICEASVKCNIPLER